MTDVRDHTSLFLCLTFIYFQSELRGVYCLWLCRRVCQCVRALVCMFTRESVAPTKRCAEKWAGRWLWDADMQITLWPVYANIRAEAIGE